MWTMTRRGLGSCYQRKDGRWVVQTSEHGVKRYSYGRTRAEAVAKARLPAPRRTRSLTDGATVAEFLAEWLVVMVPPKLAVRTHDGYTAIVERAIVPAIGDIPLARLSRLDVERTVSQWAQQRHPRTVAHYLACLRAALSKAVEWGYIAANPATRIATPRIPKGKAQAFSEEDERRFLEYVSGDATGHGVEPPYSGAPFARSRSVDPLYPLWLAAFRTGMRQGELLGLHWSDVHRDEIHVNRTLVRSKGEYLPGEPKTETSRRVIPIGPTLAAVLEAHRKAQMARPGKLDQGLVFCTPAGSPLANDVVSRRFKALCREAGVARLTMHSARHTFATRLIQKGVSLMTVSRLLGHSQIGTTVNVYGHVTVEDKRDAVAMLEVVG